MKKLLFFSFLVLLAVSLFSQTPPPERINYQGVLRDTSGNPLNGNFSMVFRFYKYEGAMTPLWEETYNLTYLPRINVSQGLFSVQLGDPSHWTGGNETNFTNVFSKYENVYLGVQVGTDSEMTPRIKVISSAYAQNSMTLNGIESSYYAKLYTAETIKADWQNTMYPWSDNEVSDVLTIGPGSTIDPSIPVGNANTLDGFDSSYFLNTSSTTQTKTGKVIFNATGANYGVEAYGMTSGGFFKDNDGSGYASVGISDSGIRSYGNAEGGYFQDIDNLSTARVAYGNYGIDAKGNTAGGYFKDLDSSGYAYIGYGDRGIEGQGNEVGGYFKDSNNSGRAYVGYGDYGIVARGNDMGGYFMDLNGTGYAYVGYGNRGIEAQGSKTGGYFKDSDNTAWAYVGAGHNGIDPYGDFEGGSFHMLGTSNWAIVASDISKISGTGSVSFVQNHPYEKDKVIVYAAPEGDEIATYTRGTGKLINGEAKIKLGETFKWVTNPDIGLTAHLTPRDKPIPLAVTYLSTKELIVKDSEDVQFDYIVYGLRIGFEESSIVQEKKQESYIPSFKDHRERYSKYPDLIKYNALERFKNMESEVKGIPRDKIDLSRALSLKEAIHEYDPEKDPPVEKLFGNDTPNPSSQEILEKERISASSDQIEKDLREENKEEIIKEERIIKADENEDDLSCFVVYGQVEEGDVLVLNLQNGSSLVQCFKENDPLVVGVVSKEKKCKDGKIYVKTSGIAYVKVDANIKEIKKGDLIVTSQSLGFGMKGENLTQGTVLGKALENLEGGTGKIKVLLMSR